MREAFGVSLLWGIQPSEFWRMSIVEWWWAYGAQIEAAPRKPGTASPRKMAAAKKRLKEKMRGNG